MTATETLRRTCLYPAYKDAGARIVDFHGWELPVQFSSILKEHEAVRSACGIFDVSHMGQVEASGPGALALLEELNSNDIARLRPGDACYSHLLNERGGVVDDVIVSRLGPERYFIVVNAATADKDFAWMRARAQGRDVSLANRSEEFGMIAVQGPKAEAVLDSWLPVKGLKRFGAVECGLYGHPLLVTRTGYTGEDGFELIAPTLVAPRIWENLLVRGASFGLLPCGLGARDTLRLEAGYLLYGSDIDEDHTSLEAGYAWVVKLGKGEFLGKAALLAQQSAGLTRRLIGLKLSERGVPRPGAPVWREGRRLGALCSATFSPTLRTGIGMGYLDEPSLSPGTALEVESHGRRVPAEVCAMPFYRRS